MMWKIDGNGTKSFRVWRFQFIVHNLRIAGGRVMTKYWRNRGNFYLDVYTKKHVYVLRFQFTERDER